MMIQNRQLGHPSIQSIFGIKKELDGPISEIVISHPTVHTTAINGDKFTLQKWINVNPEELEMLDSMGRTPLIYAVLGDRSDCVEILLKAGASPNGADSGRRTALHWASHKGYTQCAKYLLSKGANWKLRDSNGMTALHLAARNRSHRGLHLVLRYLTPGEIDDQDNFKRTALHWSALFGNANHIRLLVKQDANIGIPDIEGKTPLHWAASCKLPSAVQCVKILLDHAASVINWQDYEGRTALHLAVADGTKEVVEILTSAFNCNMNPMDNMFRTPLHWAAVLGFADITKLLLERKADPTSSDANGATPLHYAAQNNAAETVDVFLCYTNMNDEPDLKGRKALLWAAGKGADDVIKIMNKHKVDLTACDKNSVTALHMAALSGHVSTCSLLLELGVPLESQDVMHHTPLFYACEMGHADVAQRLLDCNADMFSLDVDGKSVLHWAAMGGHTYVCQILLNRGFSPNCQDLCGRTALQCAAFGGHADCMSTLIENGAKHSLQDNEGMTDLHWACSKGHLPAVQLLLDYKAFPNHMAFTDERYTPLDLALLGEHYDVAQCLMENGGISINHIQNMAATRIQAFYKGYCVRKNFNEKRILLVRHEQLKRKRAENDALRSNSVQSKASFSYVHSTLPQEAQKDVSEKADEILNNNSSKETVNAESGEEVMNKAEEQFPQDILNKRHHSADHYSLVSIMRDFSPFSQGESFSEDSDDDEGVFQHLEARGIKLNRKRFPGRPHSSGELPNYDTTSESLQSFATEIDASKDVKTMSNVCDELGACVDYTVDTDSSEISDEIGYNNCIVDAKSVETRVKSGDETCKLEIEKSESDVSVVNEEQPVLYEQTRLPVDLVKSSCLDLVTDAKKSQSSISVESRLRQPEVQKPRLGILRSLRKKLGRQKESTEMLDNDNENEESSSSVNFPRPRLDDDFRAKIQLEKTSEVSHFDISAQDDRFCNAARIIQHAWKTYKSNTRLKKDFSKFDSFQLEARLAAEEIWKQCLSTISVQSSSIAPAMSRIEKNENISWSTGSQSVPPSLRQSSHFSYNLQTSHRFAK